MPCTVTETQVGNVAKIHFAWTSLAGGAIAAVSSSNFYTGKILGVITVPSGVAAPSANYDVYLLDSKVGIDQLGGNGMNRSDTATEIIGQDDTGGFSASKPWLYVLNAGDEKQATVTVFVG